MKTSLFHFDLPPERIATEPLSPRDASRLLVVGNNSIQDQMVVDLPSLLNEGDILVFNDTRVIPALLHGKRGNAQVSITLHKAVDNKNLWRVFAKPAKRLRVDDLILFSSELSATVITKHDDGSVDVNFHTDNLITSLIKYGKMPLPPYIKRESQESDNTSYQTIYAQKDGAVAAPTAGLHFTDNLFSQLRSKNIRTAFITLHVGAGTFLPVKAEDTNDHIMHSEYYEISSDTALLLNNTRKAGARIVAVGTTSLRALESSANELGEIMPNANETSIFITPGYRFKAVDILMTNFHLPQSTLFMLVCAFSGLEMMQNAYKHAIEQQYRFYSYGDACLLFKA